MDFFDKTEGVFDVVNLFIISLHERQGKSKVFSKTEIDWKAAEEQTKHHLFKGWCGGWVD